MSKSKSDIVEKKNVVQAVLIADNFSNNFLPLSNELPVALLPFVNVPLIDYALKCLSLGGIEEVFLFCCNYVDKMKAYIRNSIAQKVGWSVTMKINIIVSEGCRSLGDALRDLDAKGLIRGNFILLSADAISNIKFLPMLQKHRWTDKVSVRLRVRKSCGGLNNFCLFEKPTFIICSAILKEDKGAAMTLIFQNTGSQKSGNSSLEDTLILSNKRNRILFHQKTCQIASDTKVSFPLEIFLENSEVTIRNNIRDTHIAICSQSVLPLFSDNFDFQTRDDFIRGLLMNEEILESSIYWHELSGSEYAACVTNWNMYQFISHDLIHRWVYPLVPDLEISLHQQAYVFRQNNIYRHRDVKLAKGSELVEDVVIARGSSVDESSVITRSVIGENCKIGKNVKINDSYILNNTRIADNSIISYSFIGANCVLGKNVKITLGSILGSNVHIQAGHELHGEVLQSEELEGGTPTEKVGPRCYRVRCISKDSENTDSEEDNFGKQFNRFFTGSEPSDSDVESIISTLSDDEMSHMASPIPDDTNLFLNEVIDSLARGFEDRLQCDNLILEINSSRYAYNVTVREVYYNVTKAMLQLPFQQKSNKQYFPILVSLLTFFAPIFINYIRNEDAMIDCLEAIQHEADTCSELHECVHKVLLWFYEKDIISEEVIIRWHKKLNSQSRLYVKTNPFIQWLHEAEEESGSESE